MAYFGTINLVSGDNLPELTVTLRDSNTAAPGKRLDEDDPETWMPIDLNDRFVNMLIREQGGDLEHTLPMTVLVPPEDGRCTTIFPAGTLDRAGLFEAEFEVINEFGGAKHTVYDLLKLKIREKFDA